MITDVQLAGGFSAVRLARMARMGWDGMDGMVSQLSLPVLWFFVTRGLRHIWLDLVSKRISKFNFHKITPE